VRGAVALQSSCWVATRSGSRLKVSFKETLSIFAGSPLGDRAVRRRGGGRCGPPPRFAHIRQSAPKIAPDGRAILTLHLARNVAPLSPEPWSEAKRRRGDERLYRGVCIAESVCENPIGAMKHAVIPAL